MQTLSVQGFLVEITGAAFCVTHSNEMAGAGCWDEPKQRLVWHVKPKDRPGADVDSGTLRALDHAILENMQPFCRSCCENAPMTGDVYCWPCAASFRED